MRACWRAMAGGAGTSLIAFLLLAGAAFPCFGQAGACIAYRHNDDLLARCGSEDIRIARERGLYWYAILGDRLAIAIAEGRSPETVTVYGPKGQSQIPIHGTVLYASCGRIISAAEPDDQSVESWDVLGGTPLRLKGLQRPVCSANGEEVIGLDKTESLSSGRGELLLARDAVGDPAYGLSPSGRFSAFSSRDGVLCISKTMGARSICYRDEFPLAGTLSVDDEGAVLFSAPTGGGCFYSGFGGQHAATTGPKSTEDACYGIYMVSQDMPAKVVVPWGRSPVWVSRQTVDALARRMSATRDNR